MTSHRSSPRPHLPHLAWIVSALLLLSLLGGPATSAPPALTLHSPNPGALHLTWPAVTPAPPAYHVQYAPADTPLLIKEATSSTHTLTLYELEPGVLYTVQVRAGTGPWSAPVLQRIDDYRADPETVGTIGVGAEEAGYIESAGDTDWFFVDLAAGEGYPIAVTGAAAPPLAVYDATGAVVQQGLAWHHASALTFTPATAGLYHVAVGGPAAAPGPYTLTVDEPPTPGSRRSRTLAGATPTATPAPQRATAAPAKPTGLSATASHDQVVLTWDDPGDASITGYVILRRVRENDVGGEFSVLVADTGSAAPTYTDATVSANTTYTYRIKAINAHGVSQRSRWFHIDIPAAPEPAGQAAEPPAKPTGLSATATHNTVVLTWDDPGDASITGYVILRRLRYDDPSGHFDELVADTGSAATAYTDDTVAAETNYTYRIKAINEHGVSERSRWFHIDTSAVPLPDKPRGLRYRIDRDGTQARQSQTAQVTISWDAVTGADHYRVSRCERNCLSGSPSGWAERGGNVSGTEFTDTVTEDRVYRYRVRTIDGAYFSAWSEPLLVYVGSEHVTDGFASLPDGLDGSYDDGDGEVDLSWTCPDNPTKVTIRRNGGVPRDNDEGVSGDATLKETLWEGSGTCPTSYSDSGVTEGYKYSYTLKVYTTGHTYLADKSVEVGDQLPVIENLRLGDNNGYSIVGGDIRLNILSDTRITSFTPHQRQYRTLWRPDGKTIGDRTFSDRNSRMTFGSATGGGTLFTLKEDSAGTGLVPGVEYRFRFRVGVTDSDSNTTYGPWSYITATVVNGEIRAPYITSLAEGRTGTGSDRKMTVTLNWQSRGDAAKYEIWRAGQSCPWADFDTSNNSECKKFQTTGSGTFYTDSDGIEPSSKYRYLVYAVDADDKVHYGQWNGGKVIRTSANVDDPPPPSGVTEES